MSEKKHPIFAVAVAGRCIVWLNKHGGESELRLRRLDEYFLCGREGSLLQNKGGFIFLPPFPNALLSGGRNAKC